MVGNQEINHLRNQKKLALKLDFEYILVNFRNILIKFDEILKLSYSMILLQFLIWESSQ